LEAAGPTTCPSCGSTTGSGQRYCGASCAEEAPGRSGGPPGRRPDKPGERRLLTVLFCDLVGSTALAASLDPEDWHDVAAAYHAAAAGAVERFGGYAAHYLGDGLVAYFGYPTAHEDDAERAVRAGLDILDAIRLLNAAPQPTHGVELQVRIGIDTGPVVIGELGAARREPLALGDAPNVAARVQATAVPDTVFITETTHQLVGGLFLLEERGSHLLKGRSEPITLYRVLAPSGVRGRLDATRGPSFTPFVGREEERRLLLERWELVQEGQGQIVLITGEAGIGKSRLVRRLGEDLGGRRHTWIEGGGSPHLQGTAFAPVVDVLRQGLGWREDEEPAVRLARLERALDGAGLDRSEAVPLLSGLLGLELPDTYGPLASSPEQRRRRLMATLVQWVLTSARLQPMVLVLEDLHWIDPSTLELQALLVEQAATALSCSSTPPGPSSALHGDRAGITRMSCSTA
jgi:class 3 adenylate cyclase